MCLDPKLTHKHFAYQHVGGQKNMTPCARTLYIHVHILYIPYSCMYIYIYRYMYVIYVFSIHTSMYISIQIDLGTKFMQLYLIMLIWVPKLYPQQLIQLILCLNQTHKGGTGQSAGDLLGIGNSWEIVGIAVSSRFLTTFDHQSFTITKVCGFGVPLKF